MEEYLEKYTDLSQLYWWRNIWRNIPTCHSYIGGGVSGEIYRPVTVILVVEYLEKYTDLSQLYWWRSIWRNIPTCHSYIGGGISGEMYRPVTVILMEIYRPVTIHWQTLSHNIVSSTPRNELD
jgi:DUF1680 family protein